MTILMSPFGHMCRWPISLWRTALRLSNFILDFAADHQIETTDLAIFDSSLFSPASQTFGQADARGGESKAECHLTEVFGDNARHQSEASEFVVRHRAVAGGCCSWA